MRRYTVQDIMALDPCQPTEDRPDAGYPEDKLRRLFGDRQSVTLLEICDDERVPIMDRQWVLHRLLPEPLVHEVACRYAEHALYRERAAGRDPDPRSWAVIEAKWQWLLGEISDGDLKATSTAAWAAAGAASRVASRSSWAAASAASWAVVGDVNATADAAVASAAANASVERADWAATRDAERRWQLNTLREMIEEIED